MLSKFTKFFIFGLVLGASAISVAQQPDVVVGKIDFPKQNWGHQNLTFDVTNNTDWLKFLIVETEVLFEGSYVAPHRIVLNTYILEPEVKIEVSPELVIPGNYGQMTLWVRIFDVVDTLDDVSLGVKVFEQPFKVRFHTPETVIPYFAERITLPPLAGNHGILDNEFARLMLVLIDEGKTLEEIATICQAKLEYVTEFAEEMLAGHYLGDEPGVYYSNIPVIRFDYAKKGRKLAEQTANKLADQLATNLAGRRGVMDSLMQAGVYSGDSTNFFEGGTMLYQPYALTAGLYMWQVLGQKFITGNQNFFVFDGTDPCMADIGPYLYVVQGGDYYNGHHYYNASTGTGGFAAHFGDRIPEINCLPGFEVKKKRRQNVDWLFKEGFAPETFLYDPTLISPMLRLLDQGVTDIIGDAMEELKAMNAAQGFERLNQGTRYWFWNLTASRTIKLLIDRGVLQRSGNGQYRMMEKKD